MKRMVFAAIAAMILVFMTSHSGEARHWRGGVWVGPVYSPGWWGPSYPYYYPPQPVVVPQPEMYVQPPAPQAEEYYWYYCKNPEGYYPYIKQCPGGWIKVAPSPPETGMGE